MQDNQGYTPLHHAAGYGNVRHVILLLDAGADSTITDHRGFAPLDTALLQSNTAVARVLFDRLTALNLLTGFQHLPTGFQHLPTTERWRLFLLLSRIEENPFEYKYYLAIGRVYAEEGNRELSSQFFDKSTFY